MEAKFVFVFVLFICSWETQRGRDTDGGRSRLPVGSPMWDLIPELWDHALSWRQTLNHRTTKASLFPMHLLLYCVPWQRIYAECEVFLKLQNAVMIVRKIIWVMLIWLLIWLLMFCFVFFFTPSISLTRPINFLALFSFPGDL